VKLTQEGLDRLVAAAKGADSPYQALQGQPFNLPPGVVRTLVVGSGLSKSRPDVFAAEQARIQSWLEQGQIPVTPKPKP
jgi:hypothetical protein